MRRALLDTLSDARSAKKPTVLATDTTSGAQCLIVDGIKAGGSLALSDGLATAAADALQKDKSGPVSPPLDDLFLHVFNPPLRLIVVGAVHITQALAPMAHLAGYAVSVIDPRGAWANEDRFPNVTVLQDWPEEAMVDLAPDRRTAIVALTHDPKLDDPALAEALASDAFYVGALGSRKTAAARAERLKSSGVDPSAIAKIAGPIGLDIGAISPAEIAVAILAEITLALRGSKASRSSGSDQKVA